MVDAEAPVADRAEGPQPSFGPLDVLDVTIFKVPDLSRSVPGAIVVDTSTTKVALQNVLRVLPLATSAAIFVPLL